jgi:hypothetical protein
MRKMPLDVMNASGSWGAKGRKQRWMGDDTNRSIFGLMEYHCKQPEVPVMYLNRTGSAQNECFKSQPSMVSRAK